MSHSEDFSHLSDREKLEARVVAYLMGEASAFEEEALREAIEQDPELAAFVEATRETVQWLEVTCGPDGGGAAGKSDEATSRLSRGRRRKLRQALSAPSSSETVAPASWRPIPWAETRVLVSAAACLAVSMVALFYRAPMFSAGKVYSTRPHSEESVGADSAPSSSELYLFESESTRSRAEFAVDRAVAQTVNSARISGSNALNADSGVTFETDETDELSSFGVELYDPDATRGRWRQPQSAAPSAAPSAESESSPSLAGPSSEVSEPAVAERRFFRAGEGVAVSTLERVDSETQVQEEKILSIESRLDARFEPAMKSAARPMAAAAPPPTAMPSAGAAPEALSRLSTTSEATGGVALTDDFSQVEGFANEANEDALMLNFSNGALDNKTWAFDQQPEPDAYFLGGRGGESVERFGRMAEDSLERGELALERGFVAGDVDGDSDGESGQRFGDYAGRGGGGMGGGGAMGGGGFGGRLAREPAPMDTPVPMGSAGGAAWGMWEDVPPEAAESAGAVSGLGSLYSIPDTSSGIENGRGIMVEKSKGLVAGAAVQFDVSGVGELGDVSRDYGLAADEAEVDVSNGSMDFVAPESKSVVDSTVSSGLESGLGRRLHRVEALADGFSSEIEEAPAPSRRRSLQDRFDVVTAPQGVVLSRGAEPDPSAFFSKRFLEEAPNDGVQPGEALQALDKSLDSVEMGSPFLPALEGLAERELEEIELRQQVPDDALFGEVLGKVSEMTREAESLSINGNLAGIEDLEGAARQYFDDSLREEIVDKYYEDALVLPASPQDEGRRALGLQWTDESAERQVDFNGTNGRGQDRVAKPLPEEPQEVETAEEPLSTFSLNVSDVSFQLAASELAAGRIPEPESVRVEEFINAMPYSAAGEGSERPMRLTWDRARAPIEHRRDLLRFTIRALSSGRAQDQSMNLVVALDVSGSMAHAERQTIVSEALKSLKAYLRPEDRLSFLTFAREPRLWVDGADGASAIDWVDRLMGHQPEGATNLESGLEAAYQTAARHVTSNSRNRVLLMTDGAANLGGVDSQALRSMVETRRLEGIALDVYGVGGGDYDDSFLEEIARNGDGRYRLLNNLDTVAEDFGRALLGSLEIAAEDVKVQVEFNPDRTLRYRQIGYRKHQLKAEDFRNNAVDAAEIAAEESGTALYMVEIDPSGSGPIGTVRARYRDPATREYSEQSWTLYPSGAAPRLDDAEPETRLAASAALFGEWLRRGAPANESILDDLEPIVGEVSQRYPEQSAPAQLLTMLRQARGLVQGL